MRYGMQQVGMQVPMTERVPALRSRNSLNSPTPTPTVGKVHSN